MNCPGLRLGLALSLAALSAVGAHAHDINLSDYAVVAQADASATITLAAIDADCAARLEAFEIMEGHVEVGCADDWLFVRSETGLPPNPENDIDKIMVGITAWIQRVPVPYTYDWRIPLHPIFLNGTTQQASPKGPIALAIDGVPIFHYEARPEGDTSLAAYDPGSDTVLRGELDQCGGHSGQGEDYHYHYAPVCLVDRNHLDQPIAFALDGIPIYFGTGGDDFYGRGRTSEIDNLPDTPLDDCNSTTRPDGERVYYTTATPPYVIGCHIAEADPALRIEPRPMDGRKQRDPSPLGVGEFGEAVTTLITDYYVDGDGWHHLEFDSLSGSGTSAIVYRESQSRSGCWEFEHRLQADTPTDALVACRTN